MIASNAPAEPADAPIVALDLTRRFGRMKALDRLNMCVEAGAAYGLIGNNGAGKTTAIHLMMGFIAPNTGSISVLGLRPRQDCVQLRQRIGFFSERDAPYDWMRVETVLRIAATAYSAWDRSLCQQLCTRFDINPLKRIKELSKGMVAKLKLIVALSHKPECLILDEPTSGLDPGSRMDLLAMIADLRQRCGIPTLFSSHNLDDVADLATHIGILHQGRLKYSTAMATIRERLALASVRGARIEIPEGLRAQVVASRIVDGHCELVVDDPNHEGVHSFIDQIGRENVEWQPVTLKKLFLLLTSPDG